MGPIYLDVDRGDGTTSVELGAVSEGTLHGYRRLRRVGQALTCARAWLLTGVRVHCVDKMGTGLRIWRGLTPVVILEAGALCCERFPDASLRVWCPDRQILWPELFGSNVAQLSAATIELSWQLDRAPEMHAVTLCEDCIVQHDLVKCEALLVGVLIGRCDLCGNDNAADLIRRRMSDIEQVNPALATRLKTRRC